MTFQISQKKDQL